MIQISPEQLKELQPCTKYIPDQVWVTLLRHFRNPAPAPLSSPDRSALQQPYLCSAMLVCKSFHAICAPLLYDHIITDDLLLLFSHIDDHTSPNFPTKRDHLLRTKTLLIEYSAKGEEPTYAQLLGPGGGAYFSGIGFDLISKSRQEFAECEFELKFIRTWLFNLHKTSMAEILPRLESIAVASLYGSPSDAWENYHNQMVTTPRSEEIPDTATAFHKFLASGNLRHFCLRARAGPLSLDGFYPAGGNTFHSTTHFSSELGFWPVTPSLDFAVDDPGAAMSSTVHWVCDGPASNLWDPIIRHIGRYLAFIEVALDESSDRGPGLRLDLTIFCSTAVLENPSFDPGQLLCDLMRFGPVIPPVSMTSLTPTVHYPLSPSLQKTMAAQIDREVQPLFVKPGRKISWRSSQDAPACEACGWMQAE